MLSTSGSCSATETESPAILPGTAACKHTKFNINYLYTKIIDIHVQNISSYLACVKYSMLLISDAVVIAVIVRFFVFNIKT